MAVLVLVLATLSCWSIAIGIDNTFHKYCSHLCPWKSVAWLSLQIYKVYLAYSPHTVSAAYERGENHVNSVLDAKNQVFLVLFGHGRQVDRGSGQVTALLAAQQTAILDRALEEVWSFLGDQKGDQTVIHVDVLTDVNHLDSHNHPNTTLNQLNILPNNWSSNQSTNQSINGSINQWIDYLTG